MVGVFQETYAEPVSAKYDKGLTIKSKGGNYSMKMNGRVQARYHYEAVEDAKDKTAFSIPRSRLKLTGSVFDKDFTYLFQFDVGGAGFSVKDMYGNYAFTPRLHIRAGQFKKPFSRQQITSSGKLELVDRSITDVAFGAGRDIGVMLHNDYEKSPRWEFAFGMFNGFDDVATFGGNVEVDPETNVGKIKDIKLSGASTEFSPIIVSRSGFNYGKIDGYDEVDFKGGGLRFAVANSNSIDLDLDDDNRSSFRTGLDAILHYRHMSASGALYFGLVQNGESFTDQKFDKVGFHIQGGYLINNFIQPVIRYAMISAKGEDNDLAEILGGVSLYFFNHNLKWQSDVGVIVDSSPQVGRNANGLLRTQVQLEF